MFPRTLGLMAVPAPRPTQPPRGIARILPPHPVQAALIMVVFTALLYGLEAYDQITGQWLDQDGIVARSVPGLWGILWAPFLHGGWSHLLGNTLPFLVFGFLAMAGGVRQWIGVTALIWIGSGAGVWLFGPGPVAIGGFERPTVTIGMSGVIFGWLVFLLFRGFFARSGRQIALAVVLVVLEGGMLFGVLPGNPGISWQAHLFGALFGLLAAFVVARVDKPAAPAPLTSGHP